MQKFTVTLEQFTGPLDLMLHLIKEKKLDLFDLAMDVLIEQYIQYLNAVENKLEIASEYLYELAALLEYKSKKCLPADPKPLEVNDYEEDPKDALVRRLIEYQQFKDISQLLNERFLERQKQLEKPIERQIIQLADDENIRFTQGNQSDLLKAMQKCLERFNYTHPMQVKITKTELSIDDRSDQLIAMIMNLVEPFSFDDMIQDVQDRGVLIVTFLAILELNRRNLLSFSFNDLEVHFKRGDAYGYNT
ncbi:MAG TPA: chromosome segregation protein ScpA [Erysipelotrichaceae bacterium]|nr:chromosome segregation protein ScpA [Erysipelotrichaceae bacterium]